MEDTQMFIIALLVHGMNLQFYRLVVLPGAPVVLKLFLLLFLLQIFNAQ